ncbi:DNA phosphorothioation-associated putative methyltransferase [Methylocaldum sp. BRCS4]|uniref:DNA phosphorothioation-associated putative methyltransferase n=1 Tax=Methylocaldum sp. 14B TaxID=1912213 RepID=UPI00098A66EF|nr:DNA phosphorothioation-associated putative methyltransferase [Methylocaldum sp. 14B]MVF23126.1 DNA phosphorothioation-associated putative methyltransferase [Methylocaldum sp. BRCS4]
MSSVGKNVAQNLYIHLSALDPNDKERRELILTASALTDTCPGQDFNVVKFSHDSARLTLLDYPGFFEEGFPALKRYWTVDLGNGTVHLRAYEGSLNPPILHRKELLLTLEHPQFAEFAALTSAAEQIGLFDDTTRIGFQQAWSTLLAQKGYRVVGHQLVPIGNEESDVDDELQHKAFRGVARYLTALTRYGFSAPVQTLARFGLLDGWKSVFDYGCGRGDDLRGLRENGIEAAGWDPYYAADREKRTAHIVNLGFVINVIEDPVERMEALRGAYALADELLVVSAMLANPESVRGTPYGDGVLTARNTFQKYYTQGELRAYLAEVLDEEPIPVGPGIFYVFKDKEAEQRFMIGRQVNRRNVLRIAHLSRPEKPARRDKAEEKYQQHRTLLEALWETWLRLGREPDRSEIPANGQIDNLPLGYGRDEGDLNQTSLNLSAITTHLGSLPAALRFVKSHKDCAEALLEQARSSRIDDLSVYFAHLQFESRKPYRYLENRLRKDVKAFFGDYCGALEAGRELLFAAGKPENIDAACREAAERGIGWLEESESLTLPTELVVQLPPVLRTYVGCSLRLYGDATSADLIKIHIRSGKLTLMSFDDFPGRPLPRMIQRTKIKLREQDLDIFEYGEAYEPPYLYRKSRYINEEFPNYAEQLAFEAELEKAGLLNFTGYGPKPSEFDAHLAQTRWEIDGFQLVRSRTIPKLEDPCGHHFTYRQLIECGETQARTGLPNRPKEPDSYTALYELATNILDPVIDYFGMIKLTYGFCSAELAKHIKGRIAPKLDQHAAHERNRLDKPVCLRLGAAVDFIVEDEDMEEVARWIMANLPFDRLYYYGADRPIHVSYSESRLGEAWELRPQAEGRKVPRAFR